MNDPADLGNEAAARMDEDALAAHRRKMESRPKISATHCEDCLEPIPEERRRRAIGCTRCVACQTVADRLAGGI